MMPLLSCKGMRKEPRNNILWKHLDAWSLSMDPYLHMIHNPFMCVTDVPWQILIFFLWAWGSSNTPKMTVKVFFKVIKHFHKKSDWVVWLMRRLKIWTIWGHSKLLEPILLSSGEASGSKYNWRNNFHPFYIFICVEYTEFLQ